MNDETTTDRKTLMRLAKLEMRVSALEAQTAPGVAYTPGWDCVCRVEAKQGVNGKGSE